MKHCKKCDYPISSQVRGDYCAVCVVKQVRDDPDPDVHRDEKPSTPLAAKSVVYRTRLGPKKWNDST